MEREPTRLESETNPIPDTRSGKPYISTGKANLSQYNNGNLMRTVRMLIVFGAGIVGVGLYFVSNSALPFATFGNCFGGVICNKMLQSLELNLFVGISVILIGLAVAILSYLELRRDVDPPNIRGPFSCELEKHNDRVPTGPAPVCS